MATISSLGRRLCSCSGGSPTNLKYPAACGVCVGIWASPGARPPHASPGWGEAPLEIEQHELRVQQVEFVRGEHRRPVLGDVLPPDRTRRLGKEPFVHSDA